MTLNISLDPAETAPLFLQIAARVRSAIATGHVTPGARLPSARALAAQLAVARGTVDEAYALLAGEGAIMTRGAAGTVVSGTARIEAIEHTPFMFAPEARSEQAAPLPFQMGLPALDAFPRKLWSNLTVQAARAIQPADLAGADPAGLPALRQAVAAYLGVARGISCSPAQVLITSGYQGALSLVRSVLLRQGDPVWMEDPGYPMTRQALETAGARVVPIRVDQDGLRVASGIAAAPKAKLAIVTPTHQCPTGVALSLPRRLALLAWAAEIESWILEDDYDSEFRYVGRPLPSLKSLDRAQRVLYAGTFSKVLSPSLRLGYLVVPPELAAAFLRASRLLTMGQPALEQGVVAAFMQKGHFARHIRRMRILYADRRRALALALEAAFGARAEVGMAAGGMHLLVRISGTGDVALAKRAAAAGADAFRAIVARDGARLRAGFAAVLYQYPGRGGAFDGCATGGLDRCAFALRRWITEQRVDCMPRLKLVPFLQAAPLALILVVFLLIPMCVLVVVSFFDYDSVQIIPAFEFTNYTDVLGSSVTWETYLNTFRYTVIVWAVTAVLGFTVAYVLAFEIQSRTAQMVLFLVCTVPFLTSNIIRMISWIPFLGREGLLNSTLLKLGLIHQPLEFLLFSDFAVVLAYTHLYTLFMVTPIFNTMMRIDRRLLEAALDNGAGWWATIVTVVLPLSKSGIAIGSIFVVTMVMGDFITVRLMSGGQSASVGLMIANQISSLQYPAACANAVVLLAIVLMMIAAILRIVDIRKEL